MEIIKIGLVGAHTRTEEAASIFGVSLAQETSKDEISLVGLVSTPPKAPEGRTYAIPIPEHLKGFEVPKDISKFINDLYPNIRAYASSKLHTIRSGKRTVVEYDDVINSFVMYMLEVTKKDDKVRYTRYDPIAWPDQPFYKWFLIQFEFFCRDAESKAGKFMATHSYLTQENNEYDEASANEVTMEQAVMHSRGVDCSSDNSLDYVYAQEVLHALRKYSEDSIKNGARDKSFETHAARLMSMKLEGYSVSEIAEDFQISSNGVNQWLSKLRTWMSEYTGEEVNIPCAV